MSIIIKGMEIPTKEYGEMVVTIYPSGHVVEYLGDMGRDFGTAVPVPPHGRLIDADALAEEHRVRAYQGMTENSYSFHTNARAWANEAPTIIPAEESEK